MSTAYSKRPSALAELDERADPGLKPREPRCDHVVITAADGMGGVGTSLEDRVKAALRVLARD